MKISVILSLIFLGIFFIILIVLEFIMTGHEHKSLFLDNYKDVMHEKYRNTSDPQLILQYMGESIQNKPHVYRQTFFLALSGSILSTVFFFGIFPDLQIEVFFPVFFMLTFVFFMELAFINYHYYQQKEEMVKTGIKKIQLHLANMEI